MARQAHEIPELVKLTEDLSKWTEIEQIYLEGNDYKELKDYAARSIDKTKKWLLDLDRIFMSSDDVFSIRKIDRSEDVMIIFEKLIKKGFLTNQYKYYVIHAKKPSEEWNLAANLVRERAFDECDMHANSLNKTM